MAMSDAWVGEVTAWGNPEGPGDTRIFRSGREIAEEVARARIAAHLKHGENSIEAHPSGHPARLAILVEEVGELAHELTYDAVGGSVRAELIDVIAVAVAWVAKIDEESRA